VVNSQTAFECRGYMLARLIVMKLVGNGSALLVRRDTALAVGDFDPSYAAAGVGGCEDLDFEVKLAAHYRIEAVRLFLVGHRWYEGNMSSDRYRMAKSYVATVARHIEENPHILPRIRRWSTADSYRCCNKPVIDQEVHACHASLLDDAPERSGFRSHLWAKGLPLAAIRNAMRYLSIVPTPKYRGTAFQSMNPEVGLNRAISALVRIRLKRMAADDLMLEDKELP
jgi:hypothetical protein